MSFASLPATLGDPAILLPQFGTDGRRGGHRCRTAAVTGKPAGLRAHTLVCFSSARMTLVALRVGRWTTDLRANTQIVSDMSRMPHAILTGISFLCAGVIFCEGASVHGLTPAASLWLTAALGITFGTRLLNLSVIRTVIALPVLMLLRLARNLAPLRFS